jgi:hypothetical protein
MKYTTTFWQHFCVIILIGFSVSYIRCEEDIRNEEELSILNLPGPLFGIGQNIVPKNSAFISGIVYQTKGQNQLDLTELWFPRVLYGIRDDFSIQLTVPTALRVREGEYESTGLEDIRLSLEYEFYHKEYNHDSMFRATVLGAFFFPTGSLIKVPPTGFGSSSFFTGETMAYFSETWYFFNSNFMHLTGTKNNIKFGDRFIYQGGMGRNARFFNNLLITLLLEYTGFLEQRDVVNNIVDTNSGGNTLFLGPSLYIATETVYFQCGIIFPILQQLNGCQSASSYIWGVFLGYRL